MEVQIISRETIKPAAYWRMPNDDPKTFLVSLMDMLSPECYIPIIFFYSMNETNGHFNEEHTTSRLKLSLSQTMACFPMLSGKIKGNFIHCSNEDDVGALFVEAKVKISMADFLRTPNLNLLPQFLPFPLLLNEPLETAVQVAAQVNFFTCGGVAIGLSLLHKIIDGTTMSAFIKSWASSSSEGAVGKLVCGNGNYSAVSSLFPLREISAGYRLISPKTPFLVSQGKSSTTRRFVFDAMAISNLKAKAKSESVPNPTTVEVATCFIWKYAMRAASRCRSLDTKEVVGSGEGPNFVHSEWQSVLVHTVNMRKRIQPPLSENNVGNLFWRSCAYFKASNTETKLADLESIVRQSLSEINNTFIEEAIGDDGFETLLNSLQLLHELYAKSSESYLFTSWRNMGFNEVNFGWGKPVWVGGGGKVFDSMVRNLIILMETRVGNGIEAWVVLDDETMKLLEKDDEFLEFASPNPSIITLACVEDEPMATQQTT